MGYPEVIKTEIKLVSIGGGLFRDPMNGDKAGLCVVYKGKAPDSVVRLRNRSRKLGFFTKTYARGYPIRQNDGTYKRYHYLQIAAANLDLLAKEIGAVMIERIEMLKKTFNPPY